MSTPTPKEDPRISAVIEVMAYLGSGVPIGHFPQSSAMTLLLAADTADDFVRVNTNDPDTIERVARWLYAEEGYVPWELEDEVGQEPFKFKASCLLATLRPSDKETT